MYIERLGQLLEEEKARGVSERQLAMQLGMHPRTLNQWKLRGSIGQEPMQFMLLCRRLHTHPNYLLGWSDNRYPTEEAALAAELDNGLAERMRAIRGPRR
jgi:hypothetical protein